MKVLLDTHIILWLAENSPNLTKKMKSIILDESNEKYVSIASCWEVCIKLSLKKLMLDGGITEFYKIINENGFLLLHIEDIYLGVLENLYFHHHDPFDRLLIATAIAEKFTLLTDDKKIDKYKICGLDIAS